MSLRLAIAAATLMVPALFAQPRPAALEPSWTARVDGGIEWCEAAGRPRPTVLLACDRAARVHAFDLAHGKSLLPEPIDTKGGVRFGGDSAGAAYLFDRYNVYAIEIPTELTAAPGTARLAWRSPISTDSAAERDDPEILVRVLDAAATPRGVLVVRSDGRVAELSRESGAVLWSALLPESRDARASVFESSAVVMLRRKDGVAAVFFDLSQAAPAPRVRECGQAWPMWSAVGKTGLIAAWPGRAALVASGDDAPRYLCEQAGGLRAAAIDVFAARSKTNDDPSLVAVDRPLVVVAESNGAISAHDSLNGKRVWTTSDDRSEPRWTRLRVQGDLVLAADANGVAAAFDAASGRKVAQTLGATSARSLGCGATGQSVFSANVASAGGAHVELLASPMMPPGRWSAKDAEPRQARYDLGSPQAVRTVLWPPGRVVLVESSAVRVYVLP